MQDWAGRTTGYAYFPDGNVQSVTNVNGTTATYTEDNAQRLTQVWNKTAGGGTIGQHTYTLDGVGNRTQLRETVARVGGGSSSYTLAHTLDRLYELTSAGQPGGGTNAYAYDPAGNRLTSGGPAMAYDKADRVTTLLYQADADSNLTTLPSGHLPYDNANRLTGASLGGGRDAYTLDGDGKRAQTATTSGLTTAIAYAYDVARPLPAMLQATEQGFGGTTSHTYVWGLELAYSADNTGAVAVDHADGLGSMRALTDGTGAVIQTYQADEFGVTIQNQGNSTQRLQYAGEERDEGGLISLRARCSTSLPQRLLSRATRRRARRRAPRR